MKKLFSLVFALVFVFGLAACVESEVEYDGTITVIIGEETQEVYDIHFLNDEEQTLLELIESVVEVETIDTSYGPMVTRVGSIESDDDGYIAILKNDAYASSGVDTLAYEDGDVFTFMYEGFTPYLIIELDDGYHVETHYVNYEEDSELTLYDLLTDHFDISYDEFDFGKMLTKVNHLEVQDGNYIALYHNGEAMVEGVSFSEFETEDTIRLALEWWDQQAQAKRMIDLFLDNYMDAFLESANYYVFAGLHHLEDVAYSLNMAAYEDDQSAGWYAKWILVGRSLGEDTGLFEDALHELATLDYPYSAALFSIALDDETFTNDFVAMIQSETLTDFDLDTLSMIMLAFNHAGITEMNDEFAAVIESELYASSYGDNAATFAHVLIALISAGIDPSDERFMHEDGQSLVNVFFAYHRGDGSFMYQLESDEADLMFTTPQAFLALVMYTQGLQEPAVQPFNFE